MNRPTPTLGEAIDDFASQVRVPAQMVAAARARGRRLVLRRRIVTGGSVVTAVALVLGAAFAAAHSPGRPVDPTGPVRPSPGPSASASYTTFTATSGVKLPGGWVVNAVGDYLYDPARHTYHDVAGAPQQELIPASRPGLAVVRTITNEDVLRVVYGNGGHGRTLKLSDAVGNYQWSPDGRRLVTAISQKEPFKQGFAIIDTLTGTIHRHWFDANAYDCSDCLLVWSSPTQVVLGINEPVGEGDERVQALQFFNADTGAPMRSLDTDGMPLHTASWSPDGRYVVGRVSMAADTYELTDLTTGGRKSFPCDGQFVTAELLLCANGGQVQTVRRDGTILTRAVLQQGPGGRLPITVSPPG